MAGGVRNTMVRSTIGLLARRGVQGTSFADVLADSGAPRGSVYHHFPGGKDELVGAALDYMATEGLAGLDALIGGATSVDDVIDGFVRMWRMLLERTDYAAGCSVAGVTVTAESDALREKAAYVFEVWAARLADLLRSVGMPGRQAREFAWTMIAAAEGAVVIARAQHSVRPLAMVRSQLHRLAAVQ